MNKSVAEAIANGRKYLGKFYIVALLLAPAIAWAGWLLGTKKNETFIMWLIAVTTYWLGGLDQLRDVERRLENKAEEERNPGIALDRYQKMVAEWANEVFPESTENSIDRHLYEEVMELRALIWKRDLHLAYGGNYEDATEEEIWEEIADIILISMHRAERRGVSLINVVHNKHMVARLRTWKYVPDVGYYRHTKEPAE